MPVCGRLEPPLIEVRDGHLAACHRRDPGFGDRVELPGMSVQASPQRSAGAAPTAI